MYQNLLISPIQILNLDCFCFLPLVPNRRNNKTGLDTFLILNFNPLLLWNQLFSPKKKNWKNTAAVLCMHRICIIVQGGGGGGRPWGEVVSSCDIIYSVGRGIACNLPPHVKRPLPIQSDTHLLVSKSLWFQSKMLYFKKRKHLDVVCWIRQLFLLGAFKNKFLVFVKRLIREIHKTCCNQGSFFRGRQMACGSLAVSITD